MGHGLRRYFFPFLFAHRAFIAPEILALAAALILRFLLLVPGAAADRDLPLSIRPSSVSSFSISSLIAMA